MKNYSFMKFPGFKDKAVTLSYDDGTVYDKKLISILKDFNIKCTINLNSELFAEKEGARRLTKNEAIELYTSPLIEIACHGSKHLSLSEVSEAEACRDVYSDRENLEKIFKKIVNGMAYANGNFDDRSVNILKACGIKYSRTCIETEDFKIPNDWLRLTPTCHHTNNKLFEIVDKFLNNSKSSYFWSKANSPKLFYLWGHSYEFNDNDNWDLIENFCKKVGNREDIYYATNIEIYNYVHAFDNIITSMDGKIIYNPTDTDIYYNSYNENVLIKKGETVYL